MIDRFLEQIDSLSEKLYTFILKIVKDRDIALDIVQDTFVRIFQIIKREQKEITDGYFFKTAYNLSLNVIGKKKRQLEEFDEDSVSTEINPLDDLLQNERRSLIDSAILQLSEKQKAVIIYRFYLGVTFDEIADIMSISTGSVKVHLARGLMNLKKMIPAQERI